MNSTTKLIEMVVEVGALLNYLLLQSFFNLKTLWRLKSGF